MKDTLLKLKDRYFNLDNGISFVLFNIITITGILGGMLSLAISFVAGIPLMQNIAVICAEFVLVACFHLANSGGKVKLAAAIICFLITAVLFPIMFFSGGGIHSGMPSWFMIGILFTFLLLDGKYFYAVGMSEIVVITICYIYAYFNQDMVEPISTVKGEYIDIYQSMMVVAAAIGVIIKFQVKSYNKVLRKNEEQMVLLEEANQAREKFLAQMSHEIITPINAILGMNDVIIRDSNDPKAKEYARDIATSGRELLTLVNEVLSLADDAREDNASHIVAPSANIMVVDDVTMNCKVFCALLAETKINITVANSGKTALKLCEDKKFDMVFMDHMMPEMDGIQCFKKIRQDRFNKNNKTPIVILTANTVDGMMEKFLKIGFDDYLAKPVSEKDLINMVIKHLPSDMFVVVNGVKEETKKLDTNEPLETATTIDDKDDIYVRFSFLNVELGMGYCMDDADFYTDMIETYLNENKIEPMTKFYADEDWTEYRVIVHAVKSTSLSIGAEKVSEEAKSLEFAARDNDIEYIKNNHERVLGMYQELLDNIKRALENDTADEQAAYISADMIDTSNSHILVVDDDNMNIMMAKKMLEGKYQISVAASGEEALDAVSKESFDLILLDIHMPGMDGHQVLNKLKENKDTDHIPVIFLTADDDIVTEAKGFDEGALDFIKKPFDQRVALKRIERILELSYLQNCLRTEVEKQTNKAEKRRIKVENLSSQLVNALADTIDAKDKYTNGHSTRVAKYSVMIAEKLGYDAEKLKQIEYIGLLHDVGKIGVPDSIINKTTKLTDEEYAFMKKHPEIGYSILKSVTELSDIGIGARWHHERYDGNGYPDKLKGEDIPEVARIIGVADAYDAMTSRRSYRDILTQEYVRSEIEKCKGTQFDPKMADVMLSIMDADKEYKLHE